MCIQYLFLAIGIMTFSDGYGFADMDTKDCENLLICLVAHIDYGFRSSPVWHNPYDTAAIFAFNYVYNLIVILILAAVISGIIIDNFADMRTSLAETMEDMRSNCFICSLTKSTVERTGQKWPQHIWNDHYMWAYARFLLYLQTTVRTELTGPETYILDLVEGLSFTFYPIERSIWVENSGSGGSDHEERTLQIKDLEDPKNWLKSFLGDSVFFSQQEMEQTAVLDEMRDGMRRLIEKMAGMQHALAEAIVQANERASQEEAKKAAGGEKA
jgi:hypothetical protein